MGIFKEDLINFGNLIDTQVEFKLRPEDFKRIFKDFDFIPEDGLLKIRGKKKVLFLRKSFEFRGREEEDKVYTERDYNLKDLGVYLRIISADGIEELEKTGKAKREGEFLKLSLYEVFKNTELYQKIPDAFRERIAITKYRIKPDALSLFITVTK